MYMLDGKYSYTVRCITNIKQNNMEQEKEKSFKVQIPEGYEIDKENSTFEYIKYKKIKSEYPKSWEDAFIDSHICGYWVNDYSDITTTNRYAVSCDKNVFKTEKQAKSALAYAQLTQLMALPCFNGNWKPNWEDTYVKYCIRSYGKQRLIINYSYKNQQFLAFKSEEKAKIFLELYEDLINTFFQNK